MMGGGPVQLGMYQQNPAQQQQQLQQVAQQRAQMEQAMQARAQMMAQEQQRAQAAAAMQAGQQQQQAPSLAHQLQGGVPGGGGQAPPSLMQQLGQFGSPANSALLNFGLETMNAANQGRGTISSLAAGLGGGAGAFIQGKQLQSQNASLAEKEEIERRLLGLQEAALRERLGIAGGGGSYLGRGVG